ncbi:MAG TPA: AAA family ATPase [Actinomycetota bacterium]|nr:AAA family ATPase [Actinomycetota bacterium]
MSGCGRCGAPTPPGARFCPTCGASLSDAPGETALKTVTVLFTDLVDSTVLGERFDPESLHGVMRGYFDAVRAVVTRYGGTVEKFIGDAVLAVFGIPELHEDDAVRAVNAGVAVHDAVRDLSRRLEQDAAVALKVRTGINTGEVLSETTDGSTGRLVGDAVNVAARLQQAAAPGEILIGPATHHLVRDAVETEPLPPLVVKGRTAPVAAHRVVRLLSARGQRARPQTPLVGRDRELRLLRETLDRVAEDRSPHLFTVLGAPGVGKSRLVAELAASSPARVLHGRCLPYGEGITYWPLAGIVQGAAGIDSADDPGEARRKLAASVGEDDEAAAVTKGVAQAVGLSDAEVTTADLAWAVRKYFEKIAARQPVVVVVDDVHWAEPALLDLLDHVLDSVLDVPLLLVCTARLELLELRPGWGGGKMNSASLVLGPLREPECRALLGALLGDSPALDDVNDAVFRVADGNPLFVEEMVSMLVEDGLLEKVDGRWTAVRELASVTVPPTIQALVSARLDRLSRAEREVVGIAAVMGKVFAPRAVRELAAAPRGTDVEDALGRLTRMQLVTPGDAEFAGERMYTFRHLLIRDTAYEHLPRATRAAIHERYADWLVHVLGDRLAEYDEVVGYHLEQAYLYRRGLGAGGTGLAGRAAQRLADGGRRAAARHDVDAAVKLLSRAADLLTDPDEARLAVLPDLGRALHEAGDYSRALAVFDEAIDLAASAGDERTATRCTIFRERSRIHRDPQVNTEDLRSVAERAVDVLSGHGDDQGLAYAWDLLSYVHDCAGRSSEALVALRHAASHAERSGIPSIISYQQRTLLRSLAWGPGEVAEVLPLAETLLSSSTAAHDRYSQVRALLTLAHAKAMTGRFDEAREHIRLQKTICSEAPFDFIDACGAFERSQVEVLAGDLAAAESEARAGCQVLERMGEKAVLPTLQAQLADVLYARGSLDEAERLVESARSLSTPDDSLTEMRWRAVRAKILAARGAVAEAVDLAREAAATAAATGYVEWHAGVLVDLAEVMNLAGRHADAAAALAQALDLYALKGNSVSRDAVVGKLAAAAPSG